MRVGVVSDTHGHLENLRRALRSLLGFGVEVLCHLGDDYDDLGAVEIPEGLEVVRVPGVFSPYYRDPSIKNRVLREFGRWRVVVSHTLERHENDLPGDPDPMQLVKDQEVDVVLYGHTHVPEVRVEGRVLLFNPGHLKDEDKKGYPPTYGLLEFFPGEVWGRVFELYAGGLLMEGRLRR